ncbi:hypothetical protein J4G08_08410 [Candidatus Poribacteria bacterium]|nr:hypothetical protein [Candidatus Poribacteria bacterium]
MAKKIETSSTLIIRTAQTDARKNVSKWRCGILGICLSLLPFFKIFVLGIAAAFVYLLIPKIDLSLPERVQIYSKHPALYTEQYRKTAKMLRCLYIICGWIVGIFILNPI